MEVKRDTINTVALDTDGDGVPNFEDACPDKKGTIANKGCPEITKKEIEDVEKELEYDAHGLEFYFASPKIKESTYPKLDAIIKIMNKYPRQRFIIEGHTDNVGDPKKNRQLALERAHHVRDYFTKRGINSKRLETVSKGDTEPIASNATAAGRSKNRRIDIHLIQKK